MTLNQALALIKANLSQNSGDSKGGKPVFLVCGFQPLHLATFLRAFQAQRQPGSEAEIITGYYGDLSGNLERAGKSGSVSAAVVIEWSDLDSRLGLRGTAGWAGADIVASAVSRLSSLANGIRDLARLMPVALLGPTLPLPPIDSTIRAQAGLLELELRGRVATFMTEVAGTQNVLIVQAPGLSDFSNQTRCEGPLDPKMEMMAGFPYTVEFASAIAANLAAVLWPKPPLKGLITDLDGTLWNGIIGEVGTDAVSWSHENHTHSYALYQRMLEHLSHCGILLGVVSKNELPVAMEGLTRHDLLVKGETFFPVLASWDAKSKAVLEILRVWNVGAESVAFIDDNRMELDEVGSALPQLTCLHYPGNDATKVWELAGNLRDLFGKPLVTDEDRLRRESIRSAAVIRNHGQREDSGDFLRSLEGTLSFDYSSGAASRARVLELINKTNQFNLNGARLVEVDWRQILEKRETITLVASYQDKFGALGAIGVLVAESLAEAPIRRLRVGHWVLSCRAFSRRIEHHMLESLLRRSKAEEIEFAFTPTSRNQPLQEFFAQIGAEGTGWLNATDISRACGLLPHKINEVQ